jgi:sulfite reductase alpha subunit-like flavoprotein
LDIFGRPKRRFFELLMKFVKDDGEKSTIAHLLSPEGKDEYKKLTLEDTVNHADVLRMFPSAIPSLEHLIGMIPSAKPRFYSIASAQSAMPTKLQLCIVIVDWKTASGELRYGSCTGYIRELQGKGEVVAVTVKPSTFTMPPSDRYPIVMAGLGTGMAPFRSFVQDRAHKKAKGKPVGPMALYYGARHKATDFLYGEELEKYQADGVLTELRPAFSRDQAHKVYVQHKITEDPDVLYEMLIKMKGYFYLCGNGGRVPSDIRNAVMEVLMKKEGITKEDADERVTEMQLQGRYNIEVW